MTDTKKLTPIQRAALAYLYAGSTSADEMEQKEMPPFYYVFKHDTWEELENLGLIRKTAPFTVEGGTKVQGIALTDYGRACARKYGLICQDRYIPERLKDYRFVDSFTLYKAVCAIMALLYFRKAGHVDKLIKKLENQHSDLWVTEWKSISEQ